MKTALITGANKGIGFETAKQLLENGYFVFIGSRDIDNGESAVEQLKNRFRAYGSHSIGCNRRRLSGKSKISSQKQNRCIGCADQQRRNKRRNAAGSFGSAG